VNVDLNVNMNATLEVDLDAVNSEEICSHGIELQRQT
jgi:hypothetical protein